MSTSCPHDPFKNQRKEKGTLRANFEDEEILMILGYKEVRRAAKDWKTFSSDYPFRVPIPSEEKLRTIRQLPIETNPPEHKDYRAIVEPFFKRPRSPEYVADIEELVTRMLGEALKKDSLEIVQEFALPLQSRALAHLLNVPEADAEFWISWGTNAFLGSDDDSAKGAALEDYIHRCLDAAEEKPGDDFFSALTEATFHDRKLTRDEMVGFVNLAFAGGRDTIINSVSYIIAYLGSHPEVLQALRDDPKMIITATEEFIRVITPITHLGRVCPVDTEVVGEKVEAGKRVSLCWASANYDETVFDEPEKILLDRKPNPHVAFGVGAHNCLGAAHARLLIRTLLQKFCEMDISVTLMNTKDNIEKESHYERTVSYSTLEVQLIQGGAQS